MKNQNLFDTLKIIIIVAFAILNVEGQIPQSFNYQALLRDTSGRIMQNQPVVMKFTIRQDKPDGLPVYEETKDTSRM